MQNAMLPRDFFEAMREALRGERILPYHEGQCGREAGVVVGGWAGLTKMKMHKIPESVIMSR